MCRWDGVSRSRGRGFRLLRGPCRMVAGWTGCAAAKLSFPNYRLLSSRRGGVRKAFGPRCTRERSRPAAVANAPSATPSAWTCWTRWVVRTLSCFPRGRGKLRPGRARSPFHSLKSPRPTDRSGGRRCCRREWCRGSSRRRCWSRCWGLPSRCRPACWSGLAESSRCGCWAN